MIRAAARLLLGGASAGAAWAAFEVAWNVWQPQLPVEALKLPSFLPPRSLGTFLGVAFATYVTLGALLGLAGLVLVRPRRPLSAASELALGTLAAGALLALLGALVWVNLLVELPPLSVRTLTFAASVTCVLGAVFAAAIALVRRRPRLAGAVVAFTFLAPVAFVALAGVAHRSLVRPPVAERGVPSAGLPNIVFVTIDTLRADHVGVYGGSVQTPVLDRFAAQGVRFGRSISQVPHTTPSHVSMFTSLYPLSHGAKNGLPMRPGFQTLPDELRRLGYHTAAFASAYTTVSQVTGLGDSFDLYVDSLSRRLSFLGRSEVEPLAVFRVMSRFTGNQVPAEVVNGRVLDWLAAGPPEPFFLWVHYFDAHAPFPASPAYAHLYLKPDATELERHVAYYDAQITYVDAKLGELLGALEGAGALRDAVVVLTSDHGESFHEPHPARREMGHGHTLYDPVLWVPLILWGPSRIAPGRVVEQQVQSIDLAPTLLDLVGAPVPASFAGHSLIPLMSGERWAAPEFALSQTANFRRPRLFAIRSPRWKLHVNPDDGVEELFDLAVDPGETESLIASHPEVAERLRRALQGGLQIDAEEGHINLDRNTVERLRAMGYLD
jgi:arylsulfatase A-like enzyme